MARSYYIIAPLSYTGRAGSFTYHHEGDELAPGQLVQIPIANRRVTGVVLEACLKPAFSTKPVTDLLPYPPLPADLMALAGWLESYYAASPSSVWRTILPAGLSKQRRAAAPVSEAAGAGLPTEPLTAEQVSTLESINQSGQSAHLIQGVTGSGKTRVYLELAARALASGKSIIVLVPEITLTHQIIAAFEAAFGSVVLTTHSQLTEAKRHLIWEEAMAAAEAATPRIIVGPRSSLFLPAHNLGLVVVDECHEPAYKQDQHPHYHAPAVAAFRTKKCSAQLVLGSATPGLGELYLGQLGRIKVWQMRSRANKLALPQATIIDLRDKGLFRLSKFITQPLHEAIDQTIGSQRQVLLYLNRRGSASSQICGSCGTVSLCPHCELPLTFHADLLRLICHHCNFRRPTAAVCPECHSADLRLLGGGTKRIEAEALRLWPHARIARLDRDSATLPFVKSAFKQLAAGELDILIGTQMVAKGLDLPAIDTVGVISADTMLHLPDFTAAERTYQLLSQVSGRSGRGDRPGQVFIQTYSPDHPAVTTAASGDIDRFAAAELAERQALQYPPYVYLLKLTLANPDRAATQTQAEEFASHLRRQAGIRITGPAPAYIEHSAGKYHWLITAKSKDRRALVQVANSLPSDRWTADLDPVNLL